MRRDYAHESGATVKTRLSHSDDSDLDIIEMLMSAPPIKNQQFQVFDNGMAAIQEFAWPRD